MGYRIRLGTFNKKVWEENIRDQPKEKVSDFLFPPGCDEDEYDPFYRPPGHTQLYEIGKYINFPEGRTPFYSFPLNEEEFDILSKEGLKLIIESYRESIYQYYLELSIRFLKINEDGEHTGLKDRIYSEENLNFLTSHLVDKLDTWKKDSYSTPYYLDEPMEKRDGAIVKSWTMEYAIFNLVHIYTFFDWEKDLLIYSGW